jgi:hypothetical protein
MGADINICYSTHVRIGPRSCWAAFEETSLDSSQLHTMIIMHAKAALLMQLITFPGELRLVMYAV